MEYRLLNNVDSPVDLRRLDIDELPEYCAELRQYIIEQCAVHPGHLASSLGAVEIAVAVHYVYDTPYDRLVWDVGHQAYAHKIITGRREAFRTNRQKGGISGFPRMAESEYDAFGAGHASVSVSAALGMAHAASLTGERRKTVAVIGDGAMTGGLAFEGLNNAGADRNTEILVILNDNDMSIDRPQGALNNYLLRLSTSRIYNRFKQGLWGMLSHTPRILGLMRRAGNAVKHGLLQNSNLFESLGFRYFGCVDGNDIRQMVRTLRAMKDIHSPKLLHVVTRKGCGFAPCMDNLSVWHAPGKFNPLTGERLGGSYKDRFQDVFGQTLVDLAERDRRVVGITPAMASGCSMNLLEERFPARFFDVGIAEEHAVTFSAGLAASGMRPFCNVYSTFMQRAFDGVIHDVALQSLPVVFCLDRAGIVGEDGPTHHGAFDLAYMGCIPNMTVAAPSDERELRNMMYTALESGVPFVIRYPRGEARGTEWRDREFEFIPVATSRCLREGTDLAVLAVGPTVWDALAAAEKVSEDGVSVAVYDVRYVKPVDAALLSHIRESFRTVLTVEDGTVVGGFGSRIAQELSDAGITVHTLGMPDSFVEHGRQKDLVDECGYGVDGIAAVLRSCRNA